MEFNITEVEILRLVVEGEKNKEIGKALNYTEHYVKNVMKKMLDKTGMSTRLELTLWYLKGGKDEIEIVPPKRRRKVK